MTATVDSLCDLADTLWPPSLAQSWDRVGLVVGDRARPVGHVHVAVDPTPAVAAEAVGAGAQLLLVHHPLFLRGVSSVSTDTAGGRVVQTLVEGGCALLVAHTNADVAVGGVNDALLAALGLPAGVPLASDGLGRVTDLEAPETLADFCARVARTLPATAGGVRTSGDPATLVRRVAVCGGSGLDLVGDAAALGADVLLTADAKHHTALDARLAHPGVAVVDVAHWASEWPWCPVAAAALESSGVIVSVSRLVTDPWQHHHP